MESVEPQVNPASTYKDVPIVVNNGHNSDNSSRSQDSKPLLQDNQPSLINGNNRSKNEYGSSNDSTDSLDYETLLSQIGVGAYTFKLLCFCALSNGADAVEIVAISFVVAEAKENLNMSHYDEGILTAVIFLGMMCGGWIWGSMADLPRYGRRRVLIYSLLCNAIFSFLSAFAPEFYSMLIVRFGSGVGVGGSIPVTFSYCSEFLPKQYRGLYLSLMAVSWPIGATFAAGMAWAIIPNINTVHWLGLHSWRIFLILCSTPAMLGCWVFYRHADYSPKWLIFTKKNFNHASRTLSKISRQNRTDGDLDMSLLQPSTLEAMDTNEGDHTTEEKAIAVYPQNSPIVGSYDNLLPNQSDFDLIRPRDGIDSSVDIDAEIALSETPSLTKRRPENAPKPLLQPIENDNALRKPTAIANSFQHVITKTLLLFTKKYRRAHILGCLIWFTLSFGFYGVAEWMPAYFNSLGSVNVYFSSFLNGIAQFPGALLTPFLIDRWLNRKITLALSMFLSGVCILAIAAVHHSWQQVLLMCCFGGVSVCGWGALDVVSTELSPTFIRSTAYGVFAASGRLGAIFGNLAFGLFSGDQLDAPIAICGLCLVAGTLCCLFLPNTKGVNIH